MRYASKLYGLLRPLASVDRPRPVANSRITNACISNAARLESLEARTLLASDTPGVAVSLDAVNYYSPAWVFSDAFKASMTWSATAVDVSSGKAGQWGSGGAVNVDANGWPLELRTWTDSKGHTYQQRLDTLMFRDINAHYPRGRYTVAWEGSGAIGFGEAAKVVESGPNSAIIDVKPKQTGIWLHIDAMDSANPIRNIHVWMPDYQGQSFAGQSWRPGDSFSPFHPAFVDRLRPFKAIRFMDWGETNGNVLSTWSQRRTVDAATQGNGDKRGVAYEYMIELVNELDADAWINIPHQADADFVQNLAALFRDNLEPERHVILEWSNEIWNTAGGFKTYDWLTQQMTLPENAGKSQLTIAADKIQGDFDIWENVFAGQGDRLVRVVSGQAGNGWVLDELLAHMDGKFDAVAVAGYMASYNRDSFTASTTADEVAQDVLNSVDGTIGALERTKELADRYSAKLGRNIQLFTYEGGQHLDGQNAPYQQAFYDAQTHPLMYEAYRELFQGFYQIGGSLFTHFTFISQNGPSGSWGSLQYTDQPTDEAPKHRALLDAASGSLFRPEVRIASINPKAMERSQLAAELKISRYGDKSQPLDVPLQISGDAVADDFTGIPTAVHFEPGEVSKIISVLPADDAVPETDESIIVTIAAGGAAYDAFPRFATARIDIVDDDGYTQHDLSVRNASFESGSFTSWQIEGDNRFAVTSRRLADGPDAAQSGSMFAWGSGADGAQRGGAKTSTLVQKLDLRSDAKRIDAGGARLAATAWGTGGGLALDNTRVEIAFFSKAGASDGKLLGTTATSKSVNENGRWTAMVADAAVPRGARGVEVRLIAERKGGDLAMTAGFDSVAATLRLPDPGQRPPDGGGDSRAAPQAGANQQSASFAPTANADIGTPSQPGVTSIVEAETDYDLSGVGAIGGTHDAAQFAYQQRSGDFDVQVRIAPVAGTPSQAGLMARASLDPNAANVFAKLDAGVTRLGYRKVAAGKTKLSGKGAFVAGEGWLRLRRVRQTFAAYRSDDGTTWRKVGSAKTKLPDSVYLGLAVGGGDSGGVGQVQFRGLEAATSPLKVAKVRRAAEARSGAVFIANPMQMLAQSHARPDERREQSDTTRELNGL